MRFVNVRELRIDTPKVLSEVTHGGQVIVTVHGKPQAVISSINEDEIESIVFNSSPFIKMLEQVRKKEKGTISLKEARAKLLHGKRR